MDPKASPLVPTPPDTPPPSPQEEQQEESGTSVLLKSLFWFIGLPIIVLLLLKWLIQI